MSTEKLAILGGSPVIPADAPKDYLFKWPIITKEDEDAALEVIRSGNFSGTDISMKLEEEFAAWQGTKHAVAFCNGTQALAAAMFAAGLGAGDEMICTTKTYWASVTPALIFGIKPVFCNINEMLSMDPNDLERCITPRMKAIMVVHYMAYPCDMDPIMEFANKHNLIVIEDVSHAQGGYYKGKKLGTFGKVAAMSMMSGKSLAAGECGMLVTNDTAVYERALAYGHYERNTEKYVRSEDLVPFHGLPLGGVKARLNQVSAAIGRVQLKNYDERIAEIDKAMNHFCDLIEDLPGIKPIRPEKGSGSTMGGWYAASGAYFPQQLHGLSAKKFCEAVTAEMNGCGDTWAGGNFCLHTHKLFSEFDFRNAGKPSSIEYTGEEVYHGNADCDSSIGQQSFSLPWFKHYDPYWVEQYAKCFRKVIENHMQLIDPSDVDNAEQGRWFGFKNVED